MKIFISWSGNASQQAASVMRRWFQHVLQFSEPFVPRSIASTARSAYRAPAA